MVGDGSYLMLSGEIATSVQEGARLTVVLLDNHGFKSITDLAGSLGARHGFNRFRMRDPESGSLGGEFLPIDFAPNAASLGARVSRAGDRASLSSALAEARRADRTTVVLVETDFEAQVPGYESWWDVPVAEVSGSESVRDAREEYERNRARERWFL